MSPRRKPFRFLTHLNKDTFFPGSEASFYDVVIIGAGGAGMMCATEAGKRGRRVALLDHQDRVGKKIAISGGGRCNFTNLQAAPGNYISEQPDFCKSALARYTPGDFIALVEKHGIAYHEKKLGQQFCDESSRAIIEMLVSECGEARVELRLNCRIESVSKTDRFRVQTSTGTLECHSLVIATGGLSFPKLGATDFGYRIARQFGLPVTATRPGLVPLTFIEGDKPLHELSGVSLPVNVRSNNREFQEQLLFTHRGVSGPAILQISSYWRETDTVHLDLLPGIRAERWLQEARGEKGDLPTQLSRRWPRRFAEAWCGRHAPRKGIQHFKAEEAAEVARLLNAWPMTFSGTEGYAKAEVTLGGISTAALSSKTMAARDVAGLFFIGEVVDVTGWLGGYNFQWAWASGHAAGQAV